MKRPHSVANRASAGVGVGVVVGARISIGMGVGVGCWSRREVQLEVVEGEAARRKRAVQNPHFRDGQLQTQRRHLPDLAIGAARASRNKTYLVGSRIART